MKAICFTFGELGFPRFYSDNERWMCLDPDVDDELLSFARCLRACKFCGFELFGAMLST